MRAVAERTAYGVAVGLEAVRGQHQLDLRAPLPRDLPQREVEHLGPLGRQQGADRRQPDVAHAGARGECRAPGQGGVVVEGGATHGEAVLLAAQRVVEVDRRVERGGERRGHVEHALGDDRHPGDRQREQVGGARVGRQAHALEGAGSGDDVLGDRAAARAGDQPGEVDDGVVPVLAEADRVEDQLVDGLGAGVGDDGRRAVDDVVLRDVPSAAGDDDVGRHVALGVAGTRDVGQQHGPGVETGGGGTTGVRHDEAAVGGVAEQAAWRAISITTSCARAPEANRATVSTPRSSASRAARWTSGGHSGRGTSTHGVGASVSQQATALHWPRRGTALAIRRRRARSAATTSTEPQPLRGPSSVDSGTTVGSMPGRSSMPCSASSARLSESSTRTSVGPGSRRSWRGCVTVVRAP